MRRAWLYGIAVLVLTGVAAESAGAQSFASSLRHLTPAAHFAGTNGYEVVVTGGRDSIVLIAERPGFRVTYATSDARTGLKRLAGSFGAAGSIEMRFRGRSRPREHTLRGCDGTYSTRRGVWRGSMRFLGTAGFTTVVATKAPGRTVTRVDLDCDTRDEERRRGGRSRNGYFLEATSGDPYERSGTRLHVGWLKGRPRADLNAAVRRKNGPVSIEYEAVLSAPRDRVHLSVRRGRARVEPGYPFVGGAKFRASDEDVDIRIGIPVEPGPTWEGNLAVALPGLGLVSLTGPDFEASAGFLTVTTLERAP